MRLTGQQLSVLGFGFLCSLGAALGQSVPDSAPQTGLLPSGTYAVDKLETIDRVNGNVMYHLSLASLPRVGSSDPFQLQLVYNSQNLVANYTYVSDPRLSPGQYIQRANLGAGSGWSYNYNYGLIERVRPTPPNGNANCPDPTSYKLYALTLVTPDGAQHPLDLYGYSDAGGDQFYSVDPSRGVNLSCNGGSTPISGPLIYFTNDGTYVRVVVNPVPNPAYFTWTAYWPDGTAVAQTYPDSNTTQTTVTDRNSNVTTISVIPASQKTIISNAAGSMSIQGQNLSPTQSEDTITTTGYGGATLTWTVHYNLQAFSGGTGYFYCDSLNTQCDSHLSALMITSIDLPSPTGVPLSFQFGYSTSNGWGNLNSIQYPSGATVTYQYMRDGSTIQVGSLFLTNPVTRKQVDYTEIQDQASASAPSQVWTFAYEVNNTACNTMTAPDQGVDTACFTQLQPTSEALTGSIYKRTSPAGQIEEKQFSFNRPAWDDSRAPNPYVSLEAATLAGAAPVAAVITHGLDLNGNETQTNEYDYVAYSSLAHGPTGQVSGNPGGAPLRSTARTYTITVPAAGNPTSTTDTTGGYWRPDTSPLLRLLARSVTTGGGTGAASEYAYSPAGDLQERRRWDSIKSPALPSPLTASSAQVEDFTYDTRGNLTSRTDARGVQTKYTYDSNNLFLMSETLAYQTGQAAPTQAQTISFTRDSSTGLMKSRTDANSVTTSYDYDALGRLTLMQEAAGHPIERDTRIKYEDASTNLRIVTCSDQNSTGDNALVSVDVYDPLGRLRLHRQLEAPSCSSPDDDSVGIKVQTRYRYDGVNSYRLTSNPYRAATSSAASSETAMGWTVTKFDQDGRVISSQTFDGSSLPAPWNPGNTANSGAATTSYDAQTTTVTDQAGKSRQSSADGLGRLAQVLEDPGTSPHFNYKTIYGYDALDDLSCVNQGFFGTNNTCDPAQPHARRFTYDSLKRLTQTIHPESGQTSYTYDGNGNLQTKTDNWNRVTTYGVYDALNRVTGKSYSDGTPAVSYAYDADGVEYAKGRLTQISVANGGAVTNYTDYDSMGQVRQSNQVIAGQTYSFSYAYNLAGSVSGETYPSGRLIGPCYDGANRVMQVSGSAAGAPTCDTGSTGQTNYVSNAAYAPHGAPAQYTYGNTLTRAYGYNAHLQSGSLSDTFASGAIQLQLVLGWNTPGGADNNGTLRALTQNNGGAGYPTFLTFNQSFTYDGVNRLASATDSGGWARTFNYDAWGNLWVTAPPSNTLAVSTQTPSTNVYNAQNQMNGTAYDPAGHQTAVNGDTLTYDAENRLVQAYDNSLKTATTYAYDGNGNRVGKTGAGGTTVYVYDALGQLAAEYASAPVASSSCTPCYVSADHLGSARLVTDHNGTVLSRHDYLPFGEEIPNGQAGRTHPEFGATDGLAQRFTGKERDTESQLDFFGARYYGSALGRFTSPDQPLADQQAEDPQSWNLYAYVRNNPLLNVDPSGQDCVTLDNGKTGDNGQGTPCPGSQTAQTITVPAFGGNEGLAALAYVGEQLNNPHEIAQFVSDAGRAAASLIAPRASAIAECITPGGSCNSTNLALAAIPGLTPAEKQIFEELQAAGHDVQIIPRTSGKTADFLVDGVATELKTLTNAGANTLKNAIQSAAKQGENILVDARNVGIDAQTASQQIQRAQGNIGNLQGRVTVLTKEGTVKF